MNPPTIGDQIQAAKKKFMEADELLSFAIKVLAGARKQLDEHQDLLRSCDGDTKRVREAIKDIDQLVSAIRIYQLPK